MQRSTAHARTHTNPEAPAHTNPHTPSDCAAPVRCNTISCCTQLQRGGCCSYKHQGSAKDMLTPSLHTTHLQTLLGTSALKHHTKQAVRRTYHTAAASSPLQPQLRGLQLIHLPAAGSHVSPYCCTRSPVTDTTGLHSCSQQPTAAAD
jgi:hypothetical protein